MANLIWSEDFSATPGTSAESLGFSPIGAPGTAIVSSSNGIQVTPGRINLFNTTESISSGMGWNLFSYPGTGGQDAATGGKSTVVMPDGSTNGYRFTFAGYGSDTGAWSGLNQSMAFTRGVAYTLSVWACTESGTANIRPYLFDSGQNITRPSADIQITTVPTRVSATITMSGTGTTPSTSTVGFGQGTGADGNRKTVVFWGAQLEVASTMSPYRRQISGTVNDNQVWYKDTGIANHAMEADILVSSFNIVPIALRVASASSFAAAKFYNGSIYITGASLSGVAIPTSLTPPFRLRVEAIDSKCYLFAGPIGGTLSPVGLTTGYSVTGMSNTATNAGFGFYNITTATPVVITDNLVANASRVFITPVDARSATIGSDTTDIMPAPDSHNVPNWVETFDKKVGIVETRGFKRWSATGWAVDNNSNALGSLSFNSVANQIQESCDFSGSVWATFGGAQKMGPAATPLFDGYPDGNTIRFAQGTLSGIRSAAAQSVPGSGNGGTVSNTFSCYVAAVSGTTKVRLGAIGRNSNWGTYYSQDFTVTETPTRISFTATESGITGAYPWFGAIVNSSTLDSTDVVAWGFQMEYGASMSEYRSIGTSKINPALWTKPVSDSRQYVELDAFFPYNYPVTQVNAILAAVRVMGSREFVGLFLGADGTSLYLHSPGRFTNLIKTLTSPSRLRIEANGNKIQVFTGPSGQRDAHDFFYETTLDENLYPGFMTSTDTGFGYSNRGGNNVAITNVSDKYESGANIGPARFFPKPADARSETRADTILPVNLAWVESFDAPAGTPLVDLGFQWKSTEFMGDPKKAVVGTNGRLTLLSSTKSSAIWTKDTINLNHFVECDITAYPLVNLEYPIIVRAADSEHFIGAWFDGNDLVIGNRYASTNTEYVRLAKTSLTLPFRLRVEVRGHYVYAFRGTTPGATARTVIGNSKGYFIDERATPLLMTSTRSGMGRVNDIQADNISDNYFGGLAFIGGATVTPRDAFSNTRVTPPDGIPVDGIARPTVRKARSSTRADFIEKDMIKVIVPININDARSDTRADVVPIQPEAVSYTRADVALVTTDRVVIEPAKSKTRADEWHEPSTVQGGTAGRSDTRADVAPRSNVHVRIYEKFEDMPGWMDKPSLIRGATSNTRADTFRLVDPMHPDPIDGKRARSGTRADTVHILPQRFASGISARSETIAEATFAAVTFVITPGDARSETRAGGPTPEQTDTYRPWLFT